MIIKAVLMVLMLVVSSSAVAKWIVVGNAENMTVYADPATIHIKGNIVKIRDLDDFKKAEIADDGESYLSTTAQDEFDCKEGQHRTLSLSCFNENMGNGDVVCIYSAQNQAEWNQITPKSINEAMWKLACGKPTLP